MLVPHKPDSLIEEVATELEAERLLVERISSFYWKRLKETMTDGNIHNVIVHNFGSFLARPRKVQKLLEKYNKILSNIEPVTFQKQQIIQEYKKNIEALETIQSLINEDVERKKRDNFLQTKAI